MKDEIALIESAYRLDVPDDEWLYMLIETLAPLGDFPRGTVGYIFDTSVPGGVELDELVTFGEMADDAESVRQLNQQTRSPQAKEALYLQGNFASTISEHMGEHAEATRDSDLDEIQDAGHGDVFGIIGSNPDGTGVFIGASLDELRTLSPNEKQLWTRVAVHLSAAHRLRRQLAHAGALDGADAIIDPQTRHVEHAAESARKKLEPLREAAARLNMARGELRRDQPDKAVELWEGLVSGEWSLVDYFDTDGRHYLVARKNAPEVAGLRALTERQRQVAWYAAHEDSNKLIAYELGLDTSTVATHLKRAMDKLGVTSRLELIRMIRSLGIDEGVESN